MREGGGRGSIFAVVIIGQDAGAFFERLRVAKEGYYDN